jgi:hypothetical protein
MEGTLRDEPISPELALVCPDLRARAIAALAEQERTGELERSVVNKPPPREYVLMQSISSRESDGQVVAPLPLAILAYVSTSVGKFTVEAAVAVGVLVGLLLIVTVMHP